MHLQLSCPGQHGIRQRGTLPCTEAGQRCRIEVARAFCLFDNQVGVTIALPGVPDNSCFFKPGLAEPVKGIGGLSPRQVPKQELLDHLMKRAPDQITYEVMKGDHLWGIASKPEAYDDPYMWPRIYRANRDQINDPDLIYPKQMLTVPIAVGENQHLVKSGDFLSKIASAVYNDPTMWHKIYKANARQIVDPGLVFPAQVLEIPAN